MLTGILSRETCAKCRFCCIFDQEDMWEAPIMTPEYVAQEITPLGLSCSEAPTEYRNERFGHLPAYVLDMTADNEGLYTCPSLTATGCGLKERKPLDCRFWPFRVMVLEDYWVLTLSSGCSELFSRPLSEIMAFADKEFQEKIFAAAAEAPQSLRPYPADMLILAVRKIPQNLL